MILGPAGVCRRETTGERRSRAPIRLGWSVGWQAGYRDTNSAAVKRSSTRIKGQEVGSAGLSRAPRWRSNAMCWEGAVGLDPGADTSTYCRFISIGCTLHTQGEPAQGRRAAGAGPRLGDPGGPMGAPAAADQLPDPSACIWPARPACLCTCAKGMDVHESHMRDLDATLPHSRSPGSDHFIVRRRPLLFVSRACCRHQLTCALATSPGGVATGRQGGTPAQGHQDDKTDDTTLPAATDRQQGP